MHMRNMRIGWVHSVVQTKQHFSALMCYNRHATSSFINNSTSYVDSGNDHPSVYLLLWQNKSQKGNVSNNQWCLIAQKCEQNTPLQPINAYLQHNSAWLGAPLQSYPSSCHLPLGSTKTTYFHWKRLQVAMETTSSIFGLKSPTQLLNEASQHEQS